MKNKTDFAYQAVYRYLVRLIDEVQTDSTTRMPSLRQLSRRLRVSISTVQSAYSLLEKEGRVCSMPKSGYYALPGGVGDETPDPVFENDNLLETFYRHVRRPGGWVLGNDEPTLLQSMESPLLAMERELLRYYPRPLSAVFQPFGDIELRTALAARHTRDAQHCWHPENVYIGPDMSGMLTAAIDVLNLRGGTVLVASPCTWTLLRLLQSFDIRVIEIPLDETGGINLAALDQVLLTENIGLAFLPSLLNPVQCSLLPLANLQAVAQLLNRYRVWVLENDSHGELVFAPEPTRLRDLIDPQRLLILGSFDKTLGPEAPYGYLLCKHFEVQWQQYFLLRAFELPPIRQKAIARLCSSGRLDAHLVELRGLLVERMKMMVQLLDRHLGQLLRYELPEGGCGIWVQSVHPVDMRQVFESLVQQRIIVTPGELFSLQGLHRQHLRIGYAIDWTQNIPRLLTALAEALKQARQH
ncbi:GntR family transcriptional regulator [Pseudomonas cichorii]|uniref:aminotransferase-like domain-containing protein n=1 Tax=Pseudomonas cichorii TaxID=36746 RepID=UPI001910DB85|nr:PLP-dependent aminotransferase family protein [Pseudomonas cichorii]GFM64023.1 GntR family transcriptional regulator [Pseudomonas cichorii]